MYTVWVQVRPYQMQSFSVNEVALDGFIARQKNLGRHIVKIEWQNW